MLQANNLPLQAKITMCDLEQLGQLCPEQVAMGERSQIN